MYCPGLSQLCRRAPSTLGGLAIATADPRRFAKNAQTVSERQLTLMLVKDFHTELDKRPPNAPHGFIYIRAGADHSEAPAWKKTIEDDFSLRHCGLCVSNVGWKKEQQFG